MKKIEGQFVRKTWTKKKVEKRETIFLLYCVYMCVWIGVHHQMVNERERERNVT